ncbi:MAG TPA: glutamate--tRNA ligase [Candidatus Magasanikbacteria bacterium]|nr:MAG: glutamate--tRNA ligase [Candidatus Magasanikbacteria bacterium RIFCSPLOWO2_02_FULL_47_16]OGH79796.1 MAG: glutamate--tRNA ligase [Candidatus Magasanikbacteria bacterium RIFCSPHIGHO2_02_FULL_48_18]OGH82583.1 MAG: glutamate--tRNA ligase [Candidatus Magasanikbacteria bacterium RIFCSPLOWO2_12_FULL_47_9b]HAZ29128.1 glutamate--tRNA ligase [Candidatus Magasanikbacteria bacterium]
MIRTRFPPSPTGFLHIGGLRTALFAYLFAKRNGGDLILRIEDTDQERFVEGGIESIVRSLEWAGIIPDEGVAMENGAITQKGSHGPYIQSERLPVYQAHIETLLGNGHAYYCFCDRERLEELRKMQELNKQPTGYDGHCRDFTEDEVEKRLAAAKKAGRAPVVRLKMPKEGETVFTDLVRGDVRFDNRLIDDQILMKSDGFPTYHFAVVVDDHTMKMTHVIRGEEWLSSTPKHVVLYQMFGWELPQFAHLSLLINEQKQKLSKRHGDVSVEDFKEKGYLPEALVNFVAFLGWNPGGDREIFSLGELVKEFDFQHVSKSAAVFNREKLDWYNKAYMKALSKEELAKRALPFFLQKGSIQGITSDGDVLADGFVTLAWLEEAVGLEQERAATLVELVDNLDFLFAAQLQYDATLLVWKKSTAEETKKTLGALFTVFHAIPEESWTKVHLEKTIMDWIQKSGLGVGDVLWPMRVALSGQKNSPGPFDIAGVLGKEKTMERVKRGLEKSVGVV